MLFVFSGFAIFDFRRFRHFERGIKSLSLEVTFLIPVLLTILTLFAFSWTDLSDLDHPLDSAFVN